MTDTKKNALPEARIAKGFRDIEAAELSGLNQMLAVIRGVYERYGFDALETPALEYTDALGKFLPDQDRPNAGVFSFQDEDEQWMSLRYDLTAPLARYVAQNFDKLPKPFRRYAFGNVYRNEKPGPGRFRQFMQFDADTVGTDNIAADAEICMLAADTLEALGIKRGDYVIKVNNRKILDGVMESAGLGGESNASRRLTVLRAIDKADRLGLAEVNKLLTVGRVDASGDKAEGAGLSDIQARKVLDAIDALVAVVGLEVSQSDELREKVKSALVEIDKISPLANASIMFSNDFGSRPLELIQTVVPSLSKPDIREQAWKIYNYIGTRYYNDSLDVVKLADEAGEKPPVKYPWGQASFPSDAMTLSAWRDAVGDSVIGQEGIAELNQLITLVRASGYGSGRIMLDPSVVRGLEYYTGPVFEAELTFEVKGDDGQPVRFGSVGGGGRYDDLVARFTGQKVPATGFSIGVSRLQAALALINAKPAQTLGPVVVLVMDKAEIASYQKMVQTLRQAGIRAEMYLGSSGMKAQVKYADKRNSPCVIIQGSDERAKGEVTIKDLIEGAKAAAAIKDNKEWKAARPAQISVPESALIDEVRKIIALHSAGQTS
jgi:histidyl-tRNA synthetase